MLSVEPREVSGAFGSVYLGRIIPRISTVLKLTDGEAKEDGGEGNE